MKTQDINRENWDLLAAYVSGNITDTKKKEVEEWLNASDENKALLTQAEKVWQRVSKESFASINTNKAWDKVLQKAAISEKQKTIWLSPKYVNYALRVAAVVVIALGVWFVWPSPNRTVIAKADNGKALVVTLPDGSVVDLNRGAEIQYPAKFNGATRNVTLKGEAFFSVQKNKQKPFIINAGTSYIKVLGTSFNVNYNSENKVEVIVNTGVVSFYSQNTNTESKPVILTKGEKGIYLAQSGSLQKCKNDDENFLSWKTGKFIFKETELKDVLYKLESYYNIQFQVSDTVLNHCRLTATFDKKSTDDILSAIKLTFDIEILKNNNTYILTGNGCNNQLLK